MKSLFELKSSNALIIGAGSGRDMASALLVKEALRNNFTRVDLAGFLTPWALHSFDGILERPINRLTKNAKKFLPSKEDIPLNVFYEPLLIRCNEEYDLAVNEFYLMSLQFGYDSLFHELLSLVELNQYDTVVVVDIGGDILASEEDYGTLLTPIVDLTCLDLISELPSSVTASLAVVSPGVCGEIGHKRLAAIYDELSKLGGFIERRPFIEDSVEYRKFRAVNKYINERTNSYSHTEQTITALIGYNLSSNYRTDYIKKYRIDDSDYRISFPVELSKEFMNSTFYFDLRKVKAARTHTFMKFQNILEIFLRVRERHKMCGTEVDGALIAQTISDGVYANPVFLLAPCCYAKGDQRRKIIEGGVKAVRDGKIERAILLRQDREYVPTDFRINAELTDHNYYILRR